MEAQERHIELLQPGGRNDNCNVLNADADREEDATNP